VSNRLILIPFVMDRVSSVSIMTGYGLGDWDWIGQVFLSSSPPHPDQLWNHQDSYPKGTRGLFAGKSDQKDLTTPLHLMQGLRMRGPHTLWLRGAESTARITLPLSFSYSVFIGTLYSPFKSIIISQTMNLLDISSNFLGIGSSLPQRTT
jgi:hypothetical protein